MADLIWSVADLLRSDYKPSDFRKVILPFTVLRRIECVLAPTRATVLKIKEGSEQQEDLNMDLLMKEASGHPFYNTSPLDLHAVVQDANDVAPRLHHYIRGFSSEVRDIFTTFDFEQEIHRLDRSGLLHFITAKFAEVDLNPNRVDDQQMGLIYEELIRRSVEILGSQGGEHFTPRDVLKLVAQLLVDPGTPTGNRMSVLDPTAGTGGALLSVADCIAERSSNTQVDIYGQEINHEAYAIARATLLLGGRNPTNMRQGNSISEDQHRDSQFDYLICIPPFGVEWRRISPHVEREAEIGFAGRFGAGLPRINDASLLFLQHLIHHMKSPAEGGSRVAILFSGSPMFTGTAGGGESEIRRWILENDLLETIVALPDQLLHNTSIFTYLWIISNRKSEHQQGKVALLDARDRWSTMRKPLGDKRRYMSHDDIQEIGELYHHASSATLGSLPADVKILHNRDFGYQRIVIDRPLRQRFEVTDDTVDLLESKKTVIGYQHGYRLLANLRALVGTSPVINKAIFEARLSTALAGLGELPKTVRNAILSAASVSDPGGELQTGVDNTPLADPHFRQSEKIPLSEDIDEYFAREFAPNMPDSWIDKAKTKVGYEIPIVLFYTNRWEGRFESLDKVARPVPPRPVGTAAATRFPVLKARDLLVVSSAADLSETGSPNEHLATCTSGDVVGTARNWRLLPDDFGTALTSLTVLRPVGHSGQALCEWLNSTKAGDRAQRHSTNLPVPVDIILDQAFGKFIDDLDNGRRSLQRATSRILPNIFNEAGNDLSDAHHRARSAAAEARFVDELFAPLDDPIWRAEWSYPFHIASLARRYRISATPAEQKDTLLKLGEGVARTLGLLALAVLIGRAGNFTSSLRGEFHQGASFGKWLTIVKRLVNSGPVVELPELEDIMVPGGAYELLNQLKNLRNRTHHAQGVRSRFQLEDDVRQVQPLLVSSLESVSWLSAVRWMQVDECQYLGNGYELIGELLHGSHPDWTPFNRSAMTGLHPKRIWVESPSSAVSIDLALIANVEVCNKCRGRELFLLDRTQGHTVELHSLNEHTLYVDDQSNMIRCPRDTTVTEQSG